eukprot:14859155-Heterocapsa_arctica.AAC.1
MSVKPARYAYSDCPREAPHASPCSRVTSRWRRLRARTSAGASSRRWTPTPTARAKAPHASLRVC